MSGTNPDRGKKFMCSPKRQTCTGVHHTFCLVGTRRLFRWPCYEADHFHLTPRLKREELCFHCVDRDFIFFSFNFLSSIIFVSVPVM